MLIDEEVDKRVSSPVQLLLLLFLIFGIILLPIGFGVYMTSIGYKLMGEIILGSTGMLFNVFLLSSVYDSNTVIPVSSSIPYAILLFVRIISYSMVGLYIPAFVSMIGGFEWLFLCLFRNNIEYE
jgi:hypothetical protein